MQTLLQQPFGALTVLLAAAVISTTAWLQRGTPIPACAPFHVCDGRPVGWFLQHMLRHVMSTCRSEARPGMRKPGTEYSRQLPGGSRTPGVGRCGPDGGEEQMEAARSRPFSASPPGPGGLEIMSIHIVALGNEGDAFHQDSRPSGLIRAYLGRSPLVSGDESSLLLSASGAAARPVFTEYQASAFGNVKLVVHDCPVWDIFDSDWYTSRNLIGGADIIVIKYNVNDKFSFHEVKDNYIPVIKRALNSVPVIIAAVGTRQNEELPCTCPLCTSDRGSCVSTTEGIQLAKELGATYLELHSLDDFYIGKYFGGVLEYFMIQALNQKTSEKMKRRKMSNSFHGIRPPQLEQPEKMPVLKAEASHYNADLNNLLFCCQCVDVVFYSPDLKEVAEAHKIVLCAVSHVFMLLFSVKSPADIQDSSIIQTTQDLFTINRDPAFPGASQESPGNPPLRVIVKDAFFCSCLSDILRFIYSGAFQWEELEDDIRKKLKDSGDVSNVIEKVKCILKTPGKFNCLRNCKTYQARKPLWFYNTSLKFFLNKPMLADVVFEIQGTTVPAHRAILVARCEVMAAMFNGNYMEAKSVLIPVYGVSKETFLSFLEYLYTDSCCPAGIFQAMCLLICAEMYQVSRLQHICELFIITQLQSMPSRELASMNLDIVDLLKKAKSGSLGPRGLTRVRTQGRLESRSSRDALEESSEKSVQNPHHPTLKTTCSFRTDYSKFHRHTREKSEAATPLSPEIAQLQGAEAPAQRVGRKTPKEQEGPQGIRPQLHQATPLAGGGGVGLGLLLEAGGDPWMQKMQNRPFP
ncbi:hypothetical protein E5288_WYG015355 [Bos mutus]|uniref:Rho-related BTB domain-containing protein 3 n=1 Tax=Bos mutus TaxID=72004 RepID=A0A6B0RCH3_9CETA|nr:hypothetical protein [Bos mutus]